MSRHALLEKKRCLASRDLRLDVPHSDRQHAAVRRLEDAEGSGELDQRRILVERDLERKAIGVVGCATGVVPEPIPERDRELAALREWPVEAERFHQRRTLGLVVRGRVCAA